jgi:hypothetical protein
LNIDADDLIGVSICQATEERTEQLPLATGLAWAYHFAIDYAIVNRPVHPARIEDVLVLDASPTLGCFESAQLTGAHCIHESLIKIYSRAFDNLKSDHARHLLSQHLLPERVWRKFYEQPLYWVRPKMAGLFVRV